MLRALSSCLVVLVLLPGCELFTLELPCVTDDDCPFARVCSDERLCVARGSVAPPDDDDDDNDDDDELDAGSDPDAGPFRMDDCAPLTAIGREYQLCTTQTTFDIAQATCESAGARLVQLDDNANATLDALEEEELSAAVRAAGRLFFWMGATDRGTEGAFLWLDGRTADATSFANGEPNDGSFEDCVEVRRSGAWNDFSCGDARAVVCELDATPTGALPVGCTLGPAPGPYLFCPALTRFPEAQTLCQGQGGSLVQFGDNANRTENANEAALVRSNATTAGVGEYWLGLTDRDEEGVFRWLDGRSLDAADDNFDVNEPNAGVPGGEDCVAFDIVRRGWGDFACELTRDFVCERP
jgi:hypothetical protein